MFCNCIARSSLCYSIHLHRPIGALCFRGCSCPIHGMGRLFRRFRPRCGGSLGRVGVAYCMKWLCMASEALELQIPVSVSSGEAISELGSVVIPIPVVMCMAFTSIGLSRPPIPLASSIGVRPPMWRLLGIHRCCMFYGGALPLETRFTFLTVKVSL